MIIACPACATRFRVDDAALAGAAERRLRCAQCGNVWGYSAPADPPILAPAELGDTPGASVAPTLYVEPRIEAEPVEPRLDTAVPPAAEPLPEPRFEPFAGPAAEPPAEPRFEVPAADTPAAESGPAAEPRPSLATEPPAPPARHYWPAVAALAFIAIFAAIVAAGLLARDRIVAMWPATDRVYAALHLAAPPGAGLQVTVTPSRTVDSLIVSGDIVNSAAVPRPIPPLRVTLRDGNKSDLATKVIDPPVRRLPPGATAHFDAVFEHPSIAATNVDVSFATD